MTPVLLALMWLAFPTNAELKEIEGYLKVRGGEIWYKKVFNPKTRHRTPLVVLHGGPGAPHNYLLPLKELANQQPVVFYDQLGCGKSSQFDSLKSDLWTINRFRDELKILIRHLGFKKVKLLGHSWGSSLALEYYLKFPKKVSQLVFIGSYFSDSAWLADARFLRELLPEKAKAIIAKYEQLGDFANPEYQEAIAEYLQRHMNRMNPWPQELLDTMDGFGTEVYETMVGPNEFQTTGTMKSYERAHMLRHISVPALFLSGRFDQVQPGTTLGYAFRVRGAKVRIFENSSHTPHLEEREEFLKEVRAFLR